MKLPAPGEAAGTGSTDAAEVPGQGTPRRRSPFAAAAPTIVIALVYAGLVGLYLAVGEVLPGERWLAIHLFTLGVLTNVILVFSEHFGRTLTRTAGDRAAWWPIPINAGIVAVLIGAAAELVVVLAAGATTVTLVVFAAYLRLRRMRRAAVGARFSWIVRMYEWAHLTFILGAILGVSLGTGLVSGRWYGPTLFAHLHATILGWAGLTLLATLVFFGPTMARTRIEEGADARAARALRIGATGLTAAVLLLIVTGSGGVTGLAARVGAGLALGVFAGSVTVVCLPVMRAVWSGRATASRPAIVALCAWFIVVVWLDVGVVSTGTWWWLDPLGVIALAGVLAQAILATLLYLAPMLRGRSPDERAEITARLERGMVARAVGFNLGVLAVAVGAAWRAGGTTLLVVGWAVLLAALVASAAGATWPITARRG